MMGVASELLSDLPLIFFPYRLCHSFLSQLSLLKLFSFYCIKKMLFFKSYRASSHYYHNDHVLLTAQRRIQSILFLKTPFVTLQSTKILWKNMEHCTPSAFCISYIPNFYSGMIRAIIIQIRLTKQKQCLLWALPIIWFFPIFLSSFVLSEFSVTFCTSHIFTVNLEMC